MGYFNAKDKHVSQIIGRRIKSLTQEACGKVLMTFTDGTVLHFYPHNETRTKPCGCLSKEPVIIANFTDASGLILHTGSKPKTPRKKKI